MNEESPSFMEENELVSFPSSKVVDEDEYMTWDQKSFNNNNTKNPKKRRLVITTMSEEPILIEIRPNLLESMTHPLVCKSIQCDDVIEEGCYKRNECLEHMSLWNKLHQVIHDTNTFKFCEENWFKKECEVEGSLVVTKKGMDCNELWVEISTQALEKIIVLKQEIQKEKEEKERYSLALTNLSAIKKEDEKQSNIQNEDCQTLKAVILELKNQVRSQAEEIRRLWIENLAIETDEINTKSNESNEDELEKTLNQDKIISIDQEIQCDFFQENDDKFAKNEVVTLVESIENNNNVELKIEELKKRKLQYQENITPSSIIDKDGCDNIIDYATLIKERDNLKEELEKVNNNFTKTSNKLHYNVAKRRKLEVESKSEKQQRSNLAAALYELESEVETTVSIINSLQATTFESMVALTNDLQNFQEALKECVISNNFETTISIQNDDEMTQSLNSETKHSPIHLEITSSNIFKGIPDTKCVISELTKGHEILLIEITSVRKAIKQALRGHKSQVCTVGKEMTSKLENIESEKETLKQKIKVFEEENKNLEEKNSKLQEEVSFLKHAKSNLTLQLKDLEKKMEDFQESLRNLREENRRLLKEAKWKSIGKQGGYQESLIIQEWEKKLQKLEVDYKTLQHEKKDLVKEKHHIEDELDKAMEKRYKGLGGSEDRKLEEELFNMTQERNKLRKIKITLAIENVSLKEALAALRIQANALEVECETLPKWKEKVQNLEEECEDLRDWKNKAEALELECKDLHNNQMKVEAYEIEHQIKNSQIKEFGKTCQENYKNTEIIDKECQSICQNKDFFEEECKNLRECKANLERECQSLHQRIDFLEKDQNTLCKFKEKIVNFIENNEDLDVGKLKIDILECRIGDLSGNGRKIEEENKNLQQSSSTKIEHCNVQEYLEKIAYLEQEIVKISQAHQLALDKQWDVLQEDLKAFEAKVEELENECESVRRDHLSSMVENAELVREKERLLTLYNDQKYNYEILETANECLQKDQEQKKAEQMKERQDYQASIDNLNQQIMDLESTFSQRLHQQASNYELFLAPKTKINGQETVTLSRQEYEVLLAEKAVILEEIDSAHKKLCSAEVQNLRLNASIDCLQQEVPCSNQGYKEKVNDTEVLLAQDVVNLRSMLSSQEVELETTTCERNKLLELNASMKVELNQLNEVLSKCQHQNQNLNITLDELKRRSSLEQIHSAASSLKEQLGKASKEKDLIKEQLNQVMKEKEGLVKVADERNKIIISLKEKITTIEEKNKHSSNIQLQDASDNVARLAQEKDQSMMVVKERDNVKKEVIILKREFEALNNKMLLVNNELVKKTKSWQKKRSNFEEKCKKLEIELMNTKETLAMIKKKLENDLQEAIKEKSNLEMVVKNEVKDLLEQVSQLQDEIAKEKQFFDKKLELATKEMNCIKVEKNTFSQEIKIFKDNLVLVHKENTNLTTDIVKYNGPTKHSMLSSWRVEDLKQSNLLIPKTLLEQGTQVNLQDLIFDTKEFNHLKKETNLTMDKQSDELKIVTIERDLSILTVSQSKMEKNIQNYFKDTCSCNLNLIEVPNCKNKPVYCYTLKENHDIQKYEKRKESCIEVTTLNQNICDFETKMKNLNDQLVDVIGKNDQLGFAKISLIYEQDSLLTVIAKFEIEKETMSENFEQDLDIEVSTIKALIGIVTKEKNQLAISEGSLETKLNDLSSIVHSQNEQLVSLSYENEHLLHTKKVVTFERDDLLKRILTFEKQLGKIAKVESKDIQKNANNNSLLTYEKISLLKDRENLIAEIVLLKKEKEDIERKLNGIIEKNSTSLKNCENALAKAHHDSYTKQELYEHSMKENTKLKEKNVTLVQTKNHFNYECKNLLTQIALVKKDNEEIKKIFRKEMVQLLSLKSKLLELISKKNQPINDVNYLSQQPNLLQVNEGSEEKYETTLHREVTILNQIIENLVEDRKSLIKKYEKYDRMQNDCSALLESKRNFNEECEILSKKLKILQNEKEILSKEHAANLLEKDQISACVVTLQAEVFNLNKRISSFNEQVTKLIEENESLHIKFQAPSFKNTKLSMNQEQQTYMSDTIELGIHCDKEHTSNFNVECIEENKHLGMKNFDVNLETLNKELEFLKQQQNELINERDNVVTSLRKTKQAYACSQVEIETLKENLMLLNRKYQQLVLERDNAIQENEFLNKQCNNILVEISTLTTNTENNRFFNESKMKEFVVPKGKSSMQQIKNLQMFMNTLKEQEIKLRKDNAQITLNNEALIKEKDSLIASISLLKKKHETICVEEFKKKGITTLEVNLQQKFEELLESVNILNKSQEGHTIEKELITHTSESLTKECDNLLATILSLKDEKLFLNSNLEHQTHAKMEQCMTIQEKNSMKPKAFSKEKLHELAKKTAILIKEYIASTKEKEKLSLEMANLKKEFQKLHSNLIVAERDKDTLMKSVLESRSTIDNFVGEINQLQRELVEARMKLAHIKIEQDNANLQIADLQRLLNNHNRMQHSQRPYALENFETLEAQSRCLGIEKGNYGYQQPLPSMKNFKIQKIEPHPPPCPSLHTSSHLFYSGPDIGRLWAPLPPMPPPPSTPHQQWPI